MAMESSRTFLPAAGVDWLLPLYDPIVNLIGAGSARKVLLELAVPVSGDCVLDIGCGTGTFAVRIKTEHPDLDVVGLDPDPKALVRAKRKAGVASAAVRFDKGFADELPYKNESINHVFSSFMFHHLPSDVKLGTLREVRRVLKPGGSLCLLDFGGPEAPGHGILSHLFHSNHRLEENSEDSVLAYMERAGFPKFEKVTERSSLFGLIQLNYFRAIA